MLQHSRTKSNNKELVQLNNMVQDYLRLAFHGYRAKDKDFNADYQTQLDPNLPEILVVSQDIGRVLLNIINNAFYAVNERFELQKDSSYKPLVMVKTLKQENIVQVQIIDNGMGISQTTIDKIFEPFYTTKPTGKGTGLGLSISYEIITKGHGGKLSVASELGKATIFNIELPIFN
jgi:two-component system, NtrC family, sensor kinase